MAIIGIEIEDLVAVVESAVARSMSVSKASTDASAAASDSSPTSTLGWIPNTRAMEVLGLSRATLQRYRDKGMLPFAKVGSNVFYRVEDIQKLLDEHLQTGRSA